jgi:hypothetical protein
MALMLTMGLVVVAYRQKLEPVVHVFLDLKVRVVVKMDNRRTSAVRIVVVSRTVYKSQIANLAAACLKRLVPAGYVVKTVVVMIVMVYQMVRASQTSTVRVACPKRSEPVVDVSVVTPKELVDVKMVSQWKMAVRSPKNAHIALISPIGMFPVTIWKEVSSKTLIFPVLQNI